MKKPFVLLFVFSLFFIQYGCKDDKQIIIPDVTEEIEIQDFIWQGLNLYYLWQENVPNLDDSKIEDQKTYVEFLTATPEPEDFFENLIYNRETVDKWSWIVDDYVALENAFAGVSMSNGVDFGLGRISGSDNLFGYVRLILPNSDASGKNIERGDLFMKVNGQQLTLDNYRELLFSDLDSYTLGLASIGSGGIATTGETVELTKFEYTENPVFMTKIIEEGGHKIGYLMYNSFTANFDDELNDAFLYLKNEAITDLVLDLRYNPGGRVSTAVSLAGMITGQFNGQLFAKERWNPKIQAEIENQNPDWLINNFSSTMSNGNTINSLGLNSVHIIVTRSSASASELIINGLDPYINVRLVGSQTSGKYTGSITLYDSENFRKDGANPRHKYAMQPIVLEMVNKVDQNAPNGFVPNISIREDLENMGQIGDSDEPMLRRAIDDIIGASAKSVGKQNLIDFEMISNTRLHQPLKDNMYIENDDLKNLFKKISINIE